MSLFNAPVQDSGMHVLASSSLGPWQVVQDKWWSLGCIFFHLIVLLALLTDRCI